MDCPWTSLGQNTGVGSLSLLQGIFPPGIEPESPALQVDSLPTKLSGREYIYLCTLYALYIMQNAGLDEAEAGIKIAGRNINNHKYADDTTLMAESEEGLGCFLKKVKEESEKLGLNSTFRKLRPWRLARSLHGK